MMLTNWTPSPLPLGMQNGTATQITQEFQSQVSTQFQTRYQTYVNTKTSIQIITEVLFIIAKIQIFINWLIDKQNTIHTIEYYSVMKKEKSDTDKAPKHVYVKPQVMYIEVFRKSKSIDYAIKNKSGLCFQFLVHNFKNPWNFLKIRSACYANEVSHRDRFRFRADHQKDQSHHLIHILSFLICRLPTNHHK